MKRSNTLTFSRASNQSRGRWGWSCAKRPAPCSKSNPVPLCPCLCQYLTSFIYFVLTSVKFRALVGAQGWAPAQAGWDAQETPSGHFLFCIVAEKGRKLNRSALSFLSSQLTGQFTSADMWKSYFVLIRCQTGFLTQSWLSHTCAGQENVSFFV